MTYHQIIGDIFDYCVELLIISAQAIGMTYEEINVWLFIVFEPVVFVMILLYAWRLRNQNAQLRKQLDPINRSSHNADSRCTGYLVSPSTS